MKLTSEALRVELNDEEVSGGEILITDSGVQLELKNQQIEPLITITFEDEERLIDFFGWLAKHIPVREEDDITRESIVNGIEELKSLND